MQNDHLTVPSIDPETSRPRSSSRTSHHSLSSQGNSVASTSNPIPRQNYARRPSIRIRRIPSLQTVTQANTQANSLAQNSQSHARQQQTGRSRSNSAPQRLYIPPALDGQSGQDHLADVTEEAVSPTTGNVTGTLSRVLDAESDASRPVPPTPGGSRVGRRLRRALSSANAEEEAHEDDYEDGLVDYLDIVGM
jgi:hypothetical protein